MPNPLRAIGVFYALTQASGAVSRGTDPQGPGNIPAPEVRPGLSAVLQGTPQLLPVVRDFVDAMYDGGAGVVWRAEGHYRPDNLPAEIEFLAGALQDGRRIDYHFEVNTGGRDSAFETQMANPAARHAMGQAVGITLLTTGQRQGDPVNQTQADQFLSLYAHPRLTPRLVSFDSPDRTDLTGITDPSAHGKLVRTGQAHAFEEIREDGLLHPRWLANSPGRPVPADYQRLEPGKRAEIYDGHARAPSHVVVGAHVNTLLGNDIHRVPAHASRAQFHAHFVNERTFLARMPLAAPDSSGKPAYDDMLFVVPRSLESAAIAQARLHPEVSLYLDPQHPMRRTSGEAAREREL